MRDNPIIEGIVQHKEEDCTQKVKKFFAEQLKIPNSFNFTITRCHRLFTRQANEKSRHSPIICRFLFLHEREKVWAARFNLKGSNYFLKEHFPQEINQRRSLLFPILKKAKSLNMKASIQVDKLIVDSKSYTVDSLDKLPAKLDPADAATQRDHKVAAFYTKANPLSNFFPTPLLEIDGVKYASVEQYLQSQKAYFAEEPQIAAKIKDTVNPAECKLMGDRLVVNNQDWLSVAKTLVYKACKNKFHSDPRARKFLLDTGNTILIEAGPDKVWGVGLKLNNPQILNCDAWQGDNLLGKILMSVRSELMPNPDQHYLSVIRF
jgi:ribA/ribD-fused uncharacterized protein